MTRQAASPITDVTLNLFQGRSRLGARLSGAAEWMLKQVQHDEEGKQEQS